jgi:hypothetical protein
MWNCPQLVGHDFLDIVHSLKRTTFDVEFEFREKEEVTRTHIRRALELEKHWNTIFAQNVVHGEGNVTGSVVVIQHPSDRMPSSSVKMSWTVW